MKEVYRKENSDVKHLILDILNHKFFHLTYSTRWLDFFPKVNKFEIPIPG